MSQATEQIARQFANASLNKVNWGDVIYNVKAYGAVGDGSKDDTLAIQMLINSVTAGTIYFPPGTYKTSGLSLNNKSRLHIVGYGATLINTSSSVSALINMDNVEYIHVEGLRFKFNPKPTAYSASTGIMIKIKNYLGVYIRNCEFIEIASHAIWADNAKDDGGIEGGTTSNVLSIRDCFFKDQYTLTNNYLQSAIYLGGNGEYAKILHNEFRLCQSAIHGFGGANTLVDGNTVTSAKAAWHIENAVFYFAPATGENSGKVIITNNELNHNNNGVNMITCIGDPTRNEKRYTITGNHLLVNGVGTSSRGIYLIDADYSVVTNNYISTISTGIATQPCLTIDSCDYVIIDNNSFEYTNGISLVKNSKAIIGRNTFEDPISGAVKISCEAGSEIIPHDGVYGFRFRNTDGVLGDETDNPAWTGLRNSVGVYTVTHNLGHIKYTVSCTLDNSSTPAAFAVTRTSTNFTVRVFNLSGAAIDGNVMGEVRVSKREDSNK